jgi:hypothetical protein
MGRKPTLKVGDRIIYDGSVCVVTRVTFSSAVIHRTGKGEDRREITISPYSEVEHVA